MISLVIPCYNEGRNLPKLIERCTALTDRTGGEVVLVDNGSKDDSPRILETSLASQSACRSVRVDVNEGYGHGILSGLRAARYDILAWTHADLQTDPIDVAVGLKMFQSDPAPRRLFVKGRRHGRPASDVVFTAGMSLFETILTGQVMVDINAQPTIFHRAFFETWRDPPKDFSLDLYAYWQAKRAGLSIRRFPVHFGQRLHGTSNWNTSAAAKWKFIRRTIDYSTRLRREGVR